MTRLSKILMHAFVATSEKLGNNVALSVVLISMA